MTENYTLNDLLLYAYGEMNEDNTNSLYALILSDNTFYEQYYEIKEGLKKLWDFRLKEPKESIVAYLKSYAARQISK